MLEVFAKPLRLPLHTAQVTRGGFDPLQLGARRREQEAVVYLASSGHVVLVAKL